MRLFFNIIFALWCTFPTLGCQPAQPVGQPRNTPEPMVEDTLDMRDFNTAERKAWDDATEVWYENSYSIGCLFAHGYQLNCTDCTNLGLRLQITVDHHGKITKTKELENKIYCHHTEEEDVLVHDCLMQSFPNVVLPEIFYNKVLIVFVGRVPTC